ncbi:MAG: hypothetical protein H7210_14800 [Pyrinomonadaceae bacterium]|nr:hypothetical protein [Phycisphaerales bacterium]
MNHLPVQRPQVSPFLRAFLIPLLTVVIVLCLLPGCAGGGKASGVTSDDPLADLRNRECTPQERIAAADRAWAQALSGELDQKAVREQFKTQLFLISTTDDVRLHIVKILLSDTSNEGIADTRSVLKLRLPRENAWPIIGLICDESVKRNWTDMTPALVRSFARKVRDPVDAARPERAALLALNPGKPIEQIVYDVFVIQSLKPGASNESRMLEERARTDAWELLGRLDSDGSKRAALLASDTRIDGQPSGAGGGGLSSDSMLLDLRAAAKDLRAVPITGAELQWVRSLRSPGNTLNENWWKDAGRAIAPLSAENALGLEVRHAEAVRWSAQHRPHWLTMSRGQLLQELSQRLRPRDHHMRSSEEGDFGTATPETLEHWDAQIVWGDLLTMLVIDEALQDPIVVASLLKQAADDRENTKTELGGAIEAITMIPGGPDLSAGASAGNVGSAGSFEARAYPPQVSVRSSDTRYVASERMIASTPRSLAHYHFHVQKEKNNAYAGPSNADLEYAATNARNCLVLTSVGQGRLAVDYYQRNKVRIDLGAIGRGK